MQRCHQTRCYPTTEGWRSAPAQEPVPARRLGGGVPGALPRQDPATVPRDHQAQPGPVLARSYPMAWLTQLHHVCMLLSIHKHSLAQGANITTNRNLLLCLEMASELWVSEGMTFCRHDAQQLRCRMSSECRPNEWGLWYLRTSIDSIAFLLNEKVICTVILASL